MNRALARLAGLGLLWIRFARMRYAATPLSPVVDEQSHVSRGLSVRRRDPDAIVGHTIRVYHVAADPNPPSAS